MLYEVITTNSGSLFLQSWLTIIDTHKAMIESLLDTDNTGAAGNVPVSPSARPRRTPNKKTGRKENKIT